MTWVEPQGAAQAIEIEVEGVWPTGYVTLQTNMDMADKRSQFADFQFVGSGNIGISLFHFDEDGNSSSGDSVSFPYPTMPEPIRLRLESDADGTQRAYVDDIEALAGPTRHRSSGRSSACPSTTGPPPWRRRRGS